MPRKIRALVVDDSAFMRKALKRMLNSDPMIKVIGDAKDGASALEAIKNLRPDVVTLDVKMPGMDGLQVLEKIMREAPTAVLMVSSLTSDGGSVTLKALEMGAVDFIDKSSVHTNMDILEIADSLVRKVKVIAGVDLKKVAHARPSPAVKVRKPSVVEARVDGRPTHLVLIGSSTGGPMSLEKILRRIPGDYPGAILVVQHMPVGFTRSFADRLNHMCSMRVREAQEDDPVLPGNIYIAPAGYHLTIDGNSDKLTMSLSKHPLEAQHRPSVDVMLKSAAEKWPGRMLAIIMTGMGQDGTEGIGYIKEHGGTVIAQDEESCVVFGMPKAAYLSGNVDRMVPLSELADEICAFH